MKTSGKQNKTNQTQSIAEENVWQHRPAAARRGASKSLQIKKRSRQKLCSELRTHQIITLLNHNPKNQVVHNKSTLSIRCSRRVTYTGDVAGATRGWTPIMTKLSLVQKTKRSSALQNNPDLTDHQKTTGKNWWFKQKTRVRNKLPPKNKEKEKKEKQNRWGAGGRGSVVVRIVRV